MTQISAEFRCVKCGHRDAILDSSRGILTCTRCGQRASVEFNDYYAVLDFFSRYRLRRKILLTEKRRRATSA